MRTEVVEVDGVRARAIAGTNTILLAFDVAEGSRHGLLGFAIHRREGEKESYWLKGKKVFPSVIPNPRPGESPTTREHPIQSLLWGDYTAKPGREYRFSVVPIYGSPKRLNEGRALEMTVRTEEEGEGKHCVWFNRGAIASQAYAAKFQNAPPPSPDDPQDPQTAWLSRGLLEACLRFVDETPPDGALRVAAYEFSYPPILKALKQARRRGVDVKVIYEAGQQTTRGERVDTSTTVANERAIDRQRFPREALIRRTRRTAIPHNKFIVRLDAAGEAQSVWTGSTNFTPSGFLGQSNVGHRVNDPAVAIAFARYWELLSDDPPDDELEPELEAISPDPHHQLGAGTTCLFSPRSTARMLNWYADQIRGARSAVLFTGAFGVNAKLAEAFAIDRDFLRYLLLEKPPSRKVRQSLGHDRDLIIVPGQVLGEVWRANDEGELTLRRPIEGFELERWFLQEEHWRTQGNIFFVHTKILIVDPLSDDPLVFTGSANFSDASLRNNDENMLLIRGDTRVADIYMTEYDRLVRHFYFRDMAARLSGDSDEGEAIFLKEDDSWLEPYFREGSFKSRRRQLFIPA